MNLINSWKMDSEIITPKRKGDGEIIPKKPTPQPTKQPGRLDD